MNLEQSGEDEEAAIAYRRVIALFPGSQLSAKAGAGCTRLTTSRLRKVGGEFRPDVLICCAEALKLFEEMPKNEVQIALEIGMLGTKGPEDLQKRPSFAHPESLKKKKGSHDFS